jgi:glycerate kinase
MRVLVAPDSFKGSLSAKDAAKAMRRGALRAFASAEVDVVPLSDGGEGLTDVLAGPLGAFLRTARVTGPTGEQLEASWAMAADGSTALLESAAVVGLERVPEHRRAATATTTYGVGELVREALDAGVRRIVIGLGGTATTDGGAGMAQALGVVFDGASVPVMGGGLRDVRRIDGSRRDPRLDHASVVALSDVDNPLCGADGAAHTYAPQKGATAAEVLVLDAALAHLTALTGDPGVVPGDGAAGGLGYGLRLFARATSKRGADFVFETTALEAKIAASDLVLTGEGRLDAQSTRGKVVGAVSRLCKRHGVPVVALVGGVGAGAELLEPEGLTAYHSLCDRPMSEADAREHAAPLLEALACNVVRTFRASRRK